MGTDNLFRKRQPKKGADLKRKSATRQSMQKILIVCEGEKTEPSYFEEMIAYYKLTSTNSVTVTGDCGSNPKSVIEHAKAVDRKESKSGSPYDLIYCVFDKDAHCDYDAALEQIRQLSSSGKFNAINSVPCFEYWFVLHFSKSRRSFENIKGNSSGAQMLKELRNHIPSYQKNSKGLFSFLHNKLDDALNNSAHVRKLAEQDGETNPSTRVDILVAKLIEVKKRFYGA